MVNTKRRWNMDNQNASVAAETQSQRILIVEDDKLLRDLYYELLSDEGYNVDQAANGEEGLHKIETGGYDLVLLDIMLPKIDGLQILKEIQKRGLQKKNKSIVLLTNLGQDATIKEGLSSGASAYLIKSSLTPDQVLTEVKTFLAK